MGLESKRVEATGIDQDARYGVRYERQTNGCTGSVAGLFGWNRSNKCNSTRSDPRVVFGWNDVSVETPLKQAPFDSDPIKFY